jgi:hypothetical protein
VLGSEVTLLLTVLLVVAKLPLLLPLLASMCPLLSPWLKYLPAIELLLLLLTFRLLLLLLLLLLFPVGVTDLSLTESLLALLPSGSGTVRWPGYAAGGTDEILPSCCSDRLTICRLWSSGDVEKLLCSDSDKSLVSFTGRGFFTLS